MKKKMIVLLLFMVAIFGVVALGCGDSTSGGSGGSGGSGSSGKPADTRPLLTLQSNIAEITNFTGGGHYSYNDDVRINVTFNENKYYFLGWYYGEDLLSTVATYNCKMWDKSVTVEARFVAKPEDFNGEVKSTYDLTVKANSTRFGLVNLNDLGANDEHNQSLAAGASVKAIAITTSENLFLGWFDVENNLITTNASFSFAMPCFDYSLTAKWQCEHIWVNNECTVCGEVARSIIYKKISNGNEVSKHGILNSTDLIIPSSYNGLPVTSIGDSAFGGCGSLTSIEIPNSVTSIGDSAFYGCSSLTSIEIPNSVTSIGSRVFLDCSSLTSVTIPNSVTSIGSGAFYSCSSLTSVTIPDSVTSIGAQAFDECDSLKYNEYDNAKYLGNDINPYLLLVKAKSADVTGCEINEKTRFIHSTAFYGCSTLTSIEIPNSVTSIGDSAFIYCLKLTSVTIPDSVTSIGGSAFRGCSSLTSVTIPDSVTSIGSGAFRDCSSLTSVTIPDSVTSIGGSAFRGCSSLTSVTIPDSVTSIGEGAFRDCSKLETIYCKAGSKPYRWDSVWNDSCPAKVVWGYKG